MPVSSPPFLHRVADRLHRGRLLVDRALHPWRRWRLVRRLRRMPRPRAVLVMCSGNICRSPFAAALLARALLPLGISVHSGGLTGPGRRSPAAAVAAARRYDVALDEHRAVVVAPGAFPAADLVIVMDPIQRRILRRDLGCRDDALVALHPAVIVPGHGPVLRGDTYLRQEDALLHALVDQVDAAVARGDTLAAVRERVDLTPFRAWFTEGNKVRRALFYSYVTMPGVARAYEEATRR